MSRAIALAALGLIGCGRLGFDPSPPAGDGGPIDTPPVPDSICHVESIPLSGMPATADLAITGTQAGYAAIWIDPSGTTPAQGAVLALDHRLVATVALPAIKDTQLGGLTDTGAKLVLSTGNGNFQTTWTLDRDLANLASGPTFNDHLMAHGQYPSDVSQAPRVYVTATGASVMAGYIDRDGTINESSIVSHAVSRRVTDLSCTDGPDHAHCVWAEALTTLNGDSQCTASDVVLRPVPSISAGPVLSGDCYNVRTTSGPDAADSMNVVWTTASHRIEMRYVGSGGRNVAHSIAPSGSAPKLQFDGKRFWIAWLDGEDILQLASYDGQDAFAYYSLKGWVPLGPEAFELVRNGNETMLVLVSGKGLDVLKICT